MSDSPAPVCPTSTDTCRDEDEGCPNCGGLGIVAGCFEDTCSGADCDPEDAELCCNPKRCDWCHPRRGGDLDPAMEPDYLQDARDSYPAGFRAVLADPPYSEVDAEHYAPGAARYPTPNLIVKRALEALPVGCRVGILHYAWPGLPPDGLEVAVISVGTGRNQRARFFTVVEKLGAPRKAGGSGTARRKAREAADG